MSTAIERKKVNHSREKQALVGTKAQRRKRYKEIIQDMGARGITLEELANGLGTKEIGFADMINEHGMTLDEVVVLQQYARAIVDKDTRAAEFLRDTAGEKPSTQLEVTDNQSGLSKMSYEELIELRELLKKGQ